MLRAIIIDDEQKGRESLAQLVTDYCQNIEVSDQVSNITAAYNTIIDQKPDLIFLDIEMPGGNGFDLLEKFETIDFDVIFTTAYGHYAIKAIQYSALDYLLKPIDINELQRAVEKVKKKRNTNNQSQLFSTLLSNLKTHQEPHKLAIPDIKGFAIIERENIIRCEAKGNYTVIYLKNGESLFSTKNLKEYDDLFRNTSFLRVHNSHLINIHYIKRYDRGDGGVLVMCDDSEVEVSRRRKNELLEKITLI